MNDKQMKIAIIGGAGFIGTSLAKQLLDAGHDIKILDIAKSETYPERCVETDILDQQSLIDNLQDIEVIYHLAAVHRDDIFPRSLYYDVNVEGTENIIKAASHHNIKTIIFTSTVAVYGLNSGESKESDPPAPFNDYGHSKLQAENVLREWADEQDNAKLVLVRLVATFGPGNMGNVRTLIDQIYSKKFITIGSGQNKKTIAYVENVALFLQKVLSLPSGIHLYNYADKPDMTMIEMVKTIRGKFGMNGKGIQVPYIIGLSGGYVFDALARLTGKQFPISSVRIRKFCANTIVNSEKAYHELDFSPSYTLKDGLESMIDADFSDM